MIAIARTPNELDLEHSKADIALVRGLARQGLLTADRLASLSARLEMVAQNGKEERIRVAADKALAVMQVSLMKLLVDAGKDKTVADSITNQQINIYLPANGRETPPELTNGDSNGRY